MLANVVSMLSREGTCVAFGVSAASEAVIDIRTFFLLGGASLYGFTLFHELLAQPAAVGLSRLSRLVANGSLRPNIGLTESWTEIGTIAGRLRDRGFTGKAVLLIDG